MAIKNFEVKNFDFDKNDISNLSFDINLDQDINLVEVSDILNITNINVINFNLKNKRKSIAKVKSMSEISGTTAKPHAQKGTGRARQGSKRSVQHRGGRVCFGPVTRDFSIKLPKKILKKSLSQILIHKLQSNKFISFKEDVTFIKSAKINKILLENDIHSALFVFDCNKDNSNLQKSINNISFCNISFINALNIYDILSYDFIFVSDILLDRIRERILI